MSASLVGSEMCIRDSTQSRSPPIILARGPAARGYSNTRTPITTRSPFTDHLDHRWLEPTKLASST
eukprot:3973685-Alexandrium_andersonii.AAC.1